MVRSFVEKSMFMCLKNDFFYKNLTPELGEFINGAFTLIQFFSNSFVNSKEEST